MTGIGRWLAPTVLGIGLVSVGLAVCSATVWRPPEQISAVHEVDAATQALVADPGVMEAQADSVEIKVDSDRPMVMAIGRDTDVIAWVADSPAEHLTGFASRRDFTVGESGSDEPLASAAGSDLWIVSREYERGGSVKWQKAEEGRWSLVVAPANAGTEGEKVTMEGVRVTMTWQQTVSVPFLWPGVLLGGVLALAGAAMMVTGRGAPSAAGARAKAKTKAGPAGPAGGANAQPLLPGELPPGLGGGAVGLAEASEAADGTNQVSAMEQPDAVNQVDAALSAAAAASAAADPVPVSDDAVLAEAKPAPGGTFQESQPVELSDLRVGADGTASEPEAVLELEGVPQPEVEVPAPVPLGLDLPPIGLMEGAVTGFALEEAAEEPVADTADAVHVLSAQGPAGDISVGGPDAASTTAQPEPGEAPKSGADQTALSATAEVILPEPGEPILPGAGESALSGTGDLTRPGTGELALPEPGELIQSGAGEPPPPEPVFSASQALAAGPVPMTAGASDLEAPVNGLTRTYAGPVTSTTEGAEPAPVAPKTDAASAGATKKPKRRWFGRSAPAQTVEPAPQAAEPAVAEPPRVDLGHAAPNRSWERMAGPAWSGAQPSGVDSAADTGPGAGSTVAGQAEAFGSPAQGPAKGPGEELTSQPSQDGAGAAAGAANVPTDWMAASQNPVQSPGDSGVRSSGPDAGPVAQPEGAGASTANDVRAFFGRLAPFVRAGAQPDPEPGDGQDSAGRAGDGHEGTPVPKDRQRPPWKIGAAARASGPSMEYLPEEAPQAGPAVAPPAPLAGPEVEYGTVAAASAAPVVSPAQGAPVAASPPTAQVAPDLVTAPLEQFAGQTAGPGGDYQPTPDPSQEGLPHRVGLSPPLVTAAEKIAALKQTHTANAEEAAATIEAAMAAAAGAGETTGLTRRQIREAERTASEALQAASRNTGEIPSWQSYAPPATPQVRMQSSEEVEES